MKRHHIQSKGALEWIEEATQLLRTSPMGVLAGYYIGALPFVLGLLFFWADMSRSPLARDHVVEAALGMSLLFLWMKAWQSVFCVRLRGLVSGEPAEAMTFSRWLRICVAQAILQPAGLLLIPAALVVTVPFGWVYGFYQNATAIAEPGAEVGQSLFRRSARGTRYGTGQYHLVLLLLFFFAVLVLLNWTVACVILPGLLKMLLGIETPFSRSPLALLNTTFFATMVGLTYLSVDPIVKALHVLRCFHGEAQTTGDDLKSALRQLPKSTRQLTVVILVGALLGLGMPGLAAEQAALPPATPLAPQEAIQPQDLNRSIEEVINQQKYAWRMPREKSVEPKNAEQGPVDRFFTKVGDMMRKWRAALRDWLDKLLPERSSRPAPSTRGVGFGPGLAAGARLLLLVLLAVGLAALLYLLYRLWRRRRRGPEVLEATPLQGVPDLTDENVSAEQLPEDEWSRLARELLARGEFRLALRAYYLSSLAFLGEHQLITLARFKSNHDYERELSRRGHALDGLVAAFGENVLAFDRIWYGMHAVDQEVVHHFAANVERIRASA